MLFDFLEPLATRAVRLSIALMNCACVEVVEVVRDRSVDRVRVRLRPCLIPRQLEGRGLVDQLVLPLQVRRRRAADQARRVRRGGQVAERQLLLDEAPAST